MRFLATIFFLFTCVCLCFGQSADDLEKKLAGATADADKMDLKYELAKIYSESSSKREKALAYIKDAYGIATKLQDRYMLAKIAYLEGETLLKKREKLRAVSRFKLAKDNAVKAKDNDIALKAIQKLSAIAAQGGDYKDAYDYTREGLKIVGSNRGTSSSSSSSDGASSKTINKLITEKTKLQNENRRLEKDKRALKEEVFSLENKMKTGSSTLTPEQRKILSELGEKEKQLEDLATAKQAADERRKQLERKYDKLSKEELRNEALLKEQEKDLLAAEMETEKQANTRNILFGALGSLGLILMLVFGRLRANRKAKKEIEAKSKIIDEERKRSDELLLNILPADIANELKEKGKVAAKKYNEVSVLFTDFKNFSGIAERMTADQLVNELDHCFKAFDYIISQYESIEKIKTIGDAYMCALGLNNKKGQATDLVKAAVEMQDFMEEYKLDRSRNHKPFFEARIGIHTGPVVAGMVGFNKFAYDIWGDTVNIASRMESNGMVGRVNISDATYKQVLTKFKCDYRGKISAKNKGEIDMYFVNKAV